MGADNLKQHTTVTYVKNGTDFLQKVPRPDGGYEFIPAEDDIEAFSPLLDEHGNATGEYLAVRNEAEFRQQREMSSHEAYFNTLRQSADPKEVARSFKRLDKLESQLTQLALDRVSPVGVPAIKYIKDEQYIDWHNTYRAAQAAGKEKECEFQPVTTYQHKLVTKTGKIIRPLYAGEVGMRGSEIICLEPGYGKR